MSDIIRTIKITTAEQLEQLYVGSAWTWEGMSADEENLQQIVEWFEDEGCPLKKNEFYIISGKTMNEVYGLTGPNRYSNNLTLVAIDLYNIPNIQSLYAKKFDVGARWFDDIVDNNAHREEMMND